MPAITPRDRKQEARPCDEIDSEEGSEGNERVRPQGCWDPLTSKQVTVRYDRRKLLRVFRAYAELAEAVRQNVSRVFFRNTRCGR